MKRIGLLMCLVVGTAAFAENALKEAALPSLAPVVEQVKGAVVNVDVAGRMPGARGAGSGVIVDPKGVILTNNHVIGGAAAIRVRLEDGRVFEAEVLGSDPLTDVAVLRVKGKFEALPSARLGDSSQVRVGDWVMAIGNPFGLASSVSLGIVSALDRRIHAGPYDQFLQTDAAINPGNSGGPLYNLKGEVVGINPAIVGSGQNLGFAIPINMAKALMPQLEKDGRVTRGWLGVAHQDLNPTLAKALGMPGSEGALVTSVNDGSPAKAAGLKEEDVVVAIDGAKVASGEALARAVALKRPDSLVALSVVRRGKSVELKVKIGVRPDFERVTQSESKGAAKQNAPSRFGLMIANVDPRWAAEVGLEGAGALIGGVQPASVAELAGLERNMLVVELNRQPIASGDALVKSLKESKTGAALLFKVKRPLGNGEFAMSYIGVEAP